MGLLKAAGSAIGSTLHDQWKGAIRCDDMPDDVLMVKKTSPTGVISNGSTVIVAPGQCAIIFDNGKILDATAEDGLYTFDSSSSPSLFAGQFGQMFKEMWQRFTYNGASAKEQAVFFVNIKEIMKNKFGTPTPIVYKDWGHPIMNPRTNSLMPMKVGMRCFGTYTFIISDPFLFMSRVAGTASVYKKESLVEQMRSEVIASFSNILNSLGDEKIEAMDLPQKTDEIKQIMDENVFDEPIRKRGITLQSFSVESVSFDEESSKKIDSYEIGGDVYSQQGTLVGAYSNAVQDAAKNSAGAANGFMGIGMMNMGTGGIMGGAAQGPWQQQNTMQQQPPVQNQPAQAPSEKSEDRWECPNCHGKVKGKFCPECGTKKPEEKAKKFCSNCGKEVSEGARFCPECGNKID